MPPIGPRGRTLGPLLPARWHAHGTALHRLGVAARWAFLCIAPVVMLALILWLG